MNFSTSITLCLGLVAVGCASSYHPILTERLTYPTVKESKDLEMAYQFDILKEAGNKKYSKKENRRNVHIIAVAIKNKTTKPIDVKSDLSFYVGNHEVLLLAPEEAKHKIRQVPGIYFLCCLFWITLNDCKDNNCSSIPLPVGFIIGLVNMGVAKSANNNLLEDLARYNLMRKIIEPGQMEEGIIAIEGDIDLPLDVKLKQ